MKHELRINNYVLYDNRPFQIASISEEYPSLKTIEFGFGVVEWKDISPIPLTEELLVKCDWNGFKKFHINSYFKIDEQGCIWYCGDFTGLVIKHLHRLQNFYRDITNKELTIEI